MLKYIFSTILIILLSCKLAFGFSYYDLGMKYFSQKDMPKAEKYFYKAVRQNPYDEKARFYHAASLMNQGQYLEAEREFKRLYSADNNNIAESARKNVALIKKSRKENKKSATDYSKSNKNYLKHILAKGNNVVRWAKEDMPVKVYTDRKHALVKRAFEEWSSASKYKIKWRMVYDKEDADIIIDFVSNKKVTASKGKEYQEGVARYRYDSRGYLVHVNIEVLTRKPTNGVLYDSKKLYQTTLHEIGHSLGISGHSTYPTDVMSPISNYTPPSLTYRDRNTIMILYKLKPGYAYAGYNKSILNKYGID